MPRQSQAERRAATRRALLDATVAVLVARGYAATTTSAIVAEAGLSQGALFRYFPTKADLFGATVEDLFPRLVDTYVSRIMEGLAEAPGRSTVDTILRPLLEAMARPDTRAAAELLMAARTDDELAARLAPVQAAHRDNIRRAARKGFTQLLASEPPPELDAAVDLAVDLTFALGVFAGAPSTRVDAELALAARLLDPLFTPTTPRPER